MSEIRLAATEEDIAKCYPVMVELRPHLAAKDFPSRIKHLTRTTGLRLAYLSSDGKVRAVAGFRLSEWLAVDGKYLEIEDLVTENNDRSKGYGGDLFDWLVAYAKEKDCTHVRLVSNVARTDAHRFYVRKGLNRSAYYFSMDV